MNIKQLTIFIQNEKGRVNKTIKVLKENNIEILYMTISETSKYGILRLIVSDNDLAIKSLKKEGFVVNEIEILLLKLNHDDINNVLELLEENTINIKNMYGFLNQEQKTHIFSIQLDDIEKGKEILKEKGFELITKEEIF